MKRSIKWFAIGAILAVVFVSGATWVLASGEGTIYACANPAGQVRIVSSLDECKSQETPLHWSIVGPQGDQGDPGPKGDQGDPGQDGLNCWDLNGNNLADLGEDINGDGTISTLDCKGPKGDMGATGQKGDKGDTGAIGPQGIQGIKGDTGLQGPQGIQGIKGDTGAIGPQGIQGIKGDTGLQGPQGPKGNTGATGPQGIQGPTGATGPQGPAGVSGYQRSEVPLTCPPDTTCSYIATCPSGKRVLGGGIQIVGLENRWDSWPFIHQSYAYSSTQWRVTLYNQLLYVPDPNPICLFQTCPPLSDGVLHYRITLTCADGN